MSRLQDALARLDAAMIRLDRAAAEGQARGASQRHLLEGELASLREAYEALEGEARRVAERLDEIIDRLATITG